MSNGAIFCKKPMTYPTFDKLGATEPGIAQEIGKLSGEQAKQAIGELKSHRNPDCGPTPPKAGKCPTIDLGGLAPEAGPVPMLPGRIRPLDGNGASPKSIRDEIRQHIQICPARGPNGENVWPSAESIDKMIDQVIKSRSQGGGQSIRGKAVLVEGPPEAMHGCGKGQAVRGRVIELHSRPVQGGGGRAERVEDSVAQPMAKPMGQMLQGHVVELQGRPTRMEGHSHADHHGGAAAEPVEDSFAQPMAKPLGERLQGQVIELQGQPTENEKRLPAPDGRGYHLHQQEQTRKMLDGVKRLAPAGGDTSNHKAQTLVQAIDSGASKAQYAPAIR